MKRKFLISLLCLSALLGVSATALTSCQTKPKEQDTPVVEYWTVTIDLDNGTTPTTKQVEKGQKLTGVSEPTREGYTFAGWKANDVAWTMDEAITGNITIVAQWTANPPAKEYWTVTIDLDNGTTPTTKQVEKGQKLTGVSEPTREGYTFAGWKVNGAEWKMDTAITGNITIVAQWTANPPAKEYWTVTIDLNDGTTPTAKQVEKGQKLTGVSEPTREGYEFTGWTVNDAAWTMEEAITTNITIVAQWEAIPHATLVFGNGQKEEILYAVKKDEIFIFEAPVTPKNSNKLFTGWYLDEEYNTSYHFDKEAENGIVLYAKWSLWEEMFTTNNDDNQIMDLFADINDNSYELGSEENEKLFAEILSGEKNYRDYLNWFAYNPEYILRYNEESWRCAKLILEQGKFTEELRNKYFGLYDLTATSPYFSTSGEELGKSINVYFNEDWNIKYFWVYNTDFDSNGEIFQEDKTYKPIYLENGELQSYYLSFDALNIEVIYNEQKINCQVSASYELEPITANVYNGEIQDHETIIYQTKCNIIANNNNVYPQRFDDILLFTSSSGIWNLETVWEIFRDEALTFSNSLYPGKNKAKIRYLEMSENY
ncbi:MAG: InlB B-repeat-containing protein [Anaeroplasmataceae bacterium]|nr:InlB B-repeat-containing protein [Anaeroplasmataceae bacterium]